MVKVIVNPSASGISLDKGDKSLVVEYSYDTLWRRYEKKDNFKTTNYFYSSNWNILSEVITQNWKIFNKEYINWLWVDDVISVLQDEVNLTQNEEIILRKLYTVIELIFIYWQ